MKNFKISCLIVDDEPMALNLVESYAKKTPFLDLRGKCSSAIEAMEFLKTTPVDLLFLDIQMPDLTGIEFSKMLPKDTRVIFTTAFDEYALEGFKVEALDYLLKPFDYAEFLAAANKASTWFNLIRGKQQTSPEKVENNEFLFVKSEYKQVRIKLSEVLYFEGLKDYIKIWLKDHPKPILTLMSLKSLEDELPENQFMRVHRSFIVSLNNIEVIERSQILINDQRITVSDQYKPKFLEFINGNSLH
ncbi:LytR/AlgR family response regulator transcription factor [Cyclobacterium marinum]|uniref:Two component transcriptional regulator, LytTR family n=1 Tax=Cyclobacterium marinum (strain ATCC 25205 / DSM 745 / LMG 13164 / NCIMB 1802) TaxID=880070 RepID=G0IVB7_CYCMS|nr:LytTR family DNA-binding domain-containing protein [Cyclobacterium marinum]AEL27916.1 two component transcriptional regulator, LytTR family [Cyclobacterium marinum DSM 745]MBI0397690.1 response regulator transcription factor [Cyclobacterium marinum]